MPQIVRYGVAILLLLLVVGGVSWFVQYLPSRGIPGPPLKGGTKIDGHEVIRFSRPTGQVGPIRAIWELDKDGQITGYAMEYERNTEGSYYFPFRNLRDEPAEIELIDVSCDCTHAELCLLAATEWKSIDEMLAKTPWAEPKFNPAPEWFKFTKNERKGFAIPPQGHGIVRISWNGRKPPGEFLKLGLRFWSQPESDPQGRQFEDIMVPVIMTEPMVFDPPRITNVALGPNSKEQVEFYCWSPTRDGSEFVFGSKVADPLFQIETRALSAGECKELQDKMRAKAKVPRYRVKCAFHVKATLFENKDKLQMDQGYFVRSIPITIEDKLLEALPSVAGFVRGDDVVVGGEKDQAKVQLNTFSSAQGKVLVVPIHANPDSKIELESHYPELLKVELKQTFKGSETLKARWDLKVTVPPGAWRGPMNEHSSIVLRVAGNPPRLVRIPVVGTATH